LRAPHSLIAGMMKCMIPELFSAVTPAELDANIHENASSASPNRRRSTISSACSLRISAFAREISDDSIAWWDTAVDARRRLVLRVFSESSPESAFSASVWMSSGTTSWCSGCNSSISSASCSSLTTTYGAVMFPLYAWHCASTVIDMIWTRIHWRRAG